VDARDPLGVPEGDGVGVGAVGGVEGDVELGVEQAAGEVGGVDAEVELGEGGVGEECEGGEGDFVHAARVLDRACGDTLRARVTEGGRSGIERGRQFFISAAWAAARRAMGTRKGEQLT
jgi:hypothetical protein